MNENETICILAKRVVVAPGCSPRLPPKGFVEALALYSSAPPEVVPHDDMVCIHITIFHISHPK